MLLRYTVSNFKSIGHPIGFTLFPTNKNLDERFLRTLSTKAGKWKVLQRSGFLGPNASGKSSFIQSVAFARNYIVDGQRSGKGTGVDQFRGDLEDLNKITTFQFLFYLDEEVYEYGFSLDTKQVFDEWLQQLGENDFVPLFIRRTDENGKTEIDVKNKFANRNTHSRTLAELLKISIQKNQKNQLYLYKLYENGLKKAEKIVGWFKRLQIIFPETEVQALPIHMKFDDDLRQYIEKMLAGLDTGVFKITVASDEIDFHEFARKMDLPKDVINEVEEIKRGIVNLNGKYFIFLENKNKRTILIQLKFNHHLNNKDVQFNIEEESDGTQRLIDLLPMLFMSGKMPGVYFIDEIDRSLHTKLSRFLLNEFVRSAKNTESQIFFTAHDVNLLNLQDFRQDEIWFIEKNQKGETVLRPFSDFEVKEGQDPLKAYLNGRFGAIPVIRGVD